MRSHRILFWMVLLLLGSPASAQFQCNLEGVRGVATIRSDNSYLAVWKRADHEDILDIYKGIQCVDAKRVFHFEDREVPWQSISSIEDAAVLGFRIRTEAGEGWFGGTKLFMYDGNRFLKAFDTGEIAEVVDIDGDGYPEVVEFLGNRGSASGRARIWVWRKDAFKTLTTVPVSQLFSERVFSLLAHVSRQTTTKANP